MYNEANVQPQNYNTGHGGSDAGEPIMPGSALPAPELPPFDPSTLSGSRAPAPDARLTGVSPEQDAEHWVNEVEKVFTNTVQDPRQRAERLSELKRQYQQVVLGLQQAGRNE